MKRNFDDYLQTRKNSVNIGQIRVNIVKMICFKFGAKIVIFLMCCITYKHCYISYFGAKIVTYFTKKDIWKFLWDLPASTRSARTWKIPWMLTQKCTLWKIRPRKIEVGNFYIKVGVFLCRYLWFWVNILMIIHFRTIVSI